jgi:hypothetical protein
MYEPYPGGSGGSDGGYQPYPGGGQLPSQQRPPVPPSVQNAVRLMYAGAVVSLISLIIGVTSRSAIQTAVRKADPHYTQAQVNTAVNSAIAIAIIGGVIGIGLWLWIAQMSRSGRNWARITGTVFFGIDTILQILGLAQPGAAGSRVLGLIIWLVGLAAVVLLWRRSSSAFFKPDSSYPASGSPPSGYGGGARLPGWRIRTRPGPAEVTR